MESLNESRIRCPLNADILIIPNHQYKIKLFWRVDNEAT